MCRLILAELPIIRFHYPLSCYRVLACGQTDRHGEADEHIAATLRCERLKKQRLEKTERDQNSIHISVLSPIEPEM
jgi:hypothetical protein